MTPDDERRFGDLICEFVAACDLEMPLTLITIGGDGGDGGVRVRRLSDAGAVEICASPGADRLVGPVVVTIVDTAARAARRGSRSRPCTPCSKPTRALPARW